MPPSRWRVSQCGRERARGVGGNPDLQGLGLSELAAVAHHDERRRDLFSERNVRKRSGGAGSPSTHRVENRRRRSLPSTTALHLAAAEAHVMLGGLAAAVEHLTAANVGERLVFGSFKRNTTTREPARRVANRRFASHLRQRAIRLSSHQGAIAVRMQIEGGPQQNEAEAKLPSTSLAALVADSLAASVDLHTVRVSSAPNFWRS